MLLAATTGPVQASRTAPVTDAVDVELKATIVPADTQTAGFDYQPICEGYYHELRDGSLICVTVFAAGDDDYTHCCTVTDFGEGYHDCIPIGNTGLCGPGTVYADCKIHNCD